MDKKKKVWLRFLMNKTNVIIGKLLQHKMNKALQDIPLLENNQE